MVTSRSNKIVIAAVLAVVGVGVAWRALHRTAPPTSAQSIPAPTPPKEVRKKSAYEVRPTQDTVSEAVDRVADILRTAPASIRAEAGVTQFQMDVLADRVTTRLSLLLTGATLSEVAEEAMKDGALPWRKPTVASETIASYEHWQESWRFVPISADRAFVRVYSASDSVDMPRPWQRVAMRSILRSRHDAIPDSAQIVELIVPALTRAYGSSSGASIPVDLGFSYYWDSEKQQWMGVNVTTYLAADDTRRVIPPP